MTGDGGELVTAIEFLSPSNKIGKSGRDFYRMKQEAILSAGSSLVEIDLIRAGRHVMAVQLTRLPRHARKTYKAVVVRGWRRDRAEFYSLPIQSKLPVISIPLRKTDLDAKLDLQSLIELAYENGGYDVIDYAGRLEPALPADDNTWADELLKAAGKR